jgi:hypothetical protein
MVFFGCVVRNVKSSHEGPPRSGPRTNRVRIVICRVLKANCNKSEMDARDMTGHNVNIYGT